MSREYRSQLLPKGLNRSMREWMRGVDTQLVSAFGGKLNQKRSDVAEARAVQPLPTQFTQDYHGRMIRIADQVVESLPRGFPGMEVDFIAETTATFVDGKNLRFGGQDIALGADDVLRLKTDGVNWFRVAMGGGYQPWDCPKLIVGDCTDAFRVQDSGGLDMLHVNTVTGQVTLTGKTAPILSLVASGLVAPYEYQSFGSSGSIQNIGGGLGVISNSALFLDGTTYISLTASAGDIDLVSSQQINLQSTAGVTWVGGISGDPPALVQGNHANAFAVRRSTTGIEFNVNTITSYVEIGTSSIGHLAVGGYNPSNPSSTHGFAYNSQKYFVINGASQEAIWFDPVNDTMVFGGSSAVTSHTFQFRQSAQFLGYFAWQRSTFSTHVILPNQGTTTYVGYVGSATPGTVNLTLPLATFGGAGADPGTILIISDEIGLVAPTHKILVAGKSGQLISGAATITVANNSAAFLFSTGTGWIQFS